MQSVAIHRGKSMTERERIKDRRPGRCNRLCCCVRPYPLLYIIVLYILYIYVVKKKKKQRRFSR